MIRRISSMITVAMLLILVTACSGADQTRQDTVPEQATKTATESVSENARESTSENTEENAEESKEMTPISLKLVTMKVNDEAVQVAWENNESVKALAELASGSPLTIDASRYGGFEQVGSIGTTLPSNDVNISTDPGDIVLYTSSNIVVFFGSNSWAYTKLGHIENKSVDELRDLLGGNNVKITLTVE